ncbi:MAG TPA: hypothetical protein PKL40_09390, partial [Methanoregulaceae archaeon]|nr:hypothetical protein [Methanoregulaceae archaeon]
MNRGILFLFLSIFLALGTSGCISDLPPSIQTSPQVTPGGDIPVPPATAQTIEVPGLGTSNYSIPVLLTDLDWELARGCGWTAENLSQSASLFMDDCRIQQLIRDGWEITGIG